MTPNKTTVSTYMAAFTRTDRAQILGCLTDDVEWEIPGGFRIQGKDAFNTHIVGDGFAAKPDIVVSRLIEADDVVVAEGTVRTVRQDGTVLNIAFCDVFEMRDQKIRRLISYLMQMK
jgi:uncharacterized protein